MRKGLKPVAGCSPTSLSELAAAAGPGVGLGAGAESPRAARRTRSGKGRPPAPARRPARLQRAKMRPPFRSPEWDRSCSILQNGYF